LELINFQILDQFIYFNQILLSLFDVSNVFYDNI